MSWKSDETIVAMLPPDNHVHSQFSWDTRSNGSMELACARAVELGLPAIAFTEHVDFTAWGHDDLPPVSTVSGSGHVSIAHRERVQPLDIEAYQASIARCRDKFPQLRILTGIETGEPHLFAGSVAQVLGSGAFERVLGSLHSVVHEGRILSPERVFALGVAPEDAMRRYFEGLLDLIKGSDVFQVLAHCDFPRRYWPTGARPYDEALFEEEYRTVFRALATSGRALEINTRSPLWSVELMRWWYEEGGEAVSFGSDAHVPYRVGAQFELAVDVVEAAGFRPGRDQFDFWRR
ncbi:PHP domain-containing protein [Kineosporia mesophila]|uniref:Histidinol-phosphatase n=2 Tax=Kineosporia mesophila TaxID=566012 RepID=A0ABP6ZJ32_9ACTN